MGAPPNPFRPGAQYVPPDPNAKIYGARPLVRFLSQAVQPPSNVYVELVDVLRIVAASSQANEVVTVNYRLLLPNGDVTEGQTSVKISSDRAINIHDEPLAEGFLLTCSCKAAAATTRGQTFARIFLVNPVLGPGQPSHMLMADYVTTAMAPAHPNGRVLAPSEGPGFLRLVVISAPPAGTDVIATVPSNTLWRLESLRAVFNASAAAANRHVHFVAIVGVNYVFQAPAPGAVVATGVGDFNVAPGAAPYSDADNHFGVPFISNVHLGGASFSAIGTLTANLQAADQWSGINLSVEEWLDNV